METANKFLKEVYIPDLAARCSVSRPAKSTPIGLLKIHRLDEILSLRTERTVFNDTHQIPE